MKTLCTDTEHTFIKQRSGALTDWYWEYCLELRRGDSSEAWVKKNTGGSREMDPEQLVAQLAEFRAWNQQLHQALQQVQQQQNQPQGLVHPLSDLSQSLAQTV